MKPILALQIVLSLAAISLAQDGNRLLLPATSPSVSVTFTDPQAAPSRINSLPPAPAGHEVKTTVCVTETKKNTKTVYTSVCKEYCVMRCSLFSRCSGNGGCEDCEKRTKNVLVKKKVPACDTTQCVLKQVPAGDCLPCQK